MHVFTKNPVIPTSKTNKLRLIIIYFSAKTQETFPFSTIEMTAFR